MKRLFADQFGHILDLLRGLSEATDAQIANQANRNNWTARLYPLDDFCADLELDASKVALDRLRGALANPNVIPAHADLVRTHANSLHQVLLDQLSARNFLTLPPQRATLYNEQKPFGDQVANAFPSIAYDVEEAAKCRALERYTASVFHLMRVMEAGLHVFAKSLGVATTLSTNRSWGSILDPFRKELEKQKLTDRSPAWQKDDAFNSAVTAQLLAVKDAWRNTTMHVVEKYTEEEAEDVWNHVKGFMRQLSAKLHE